jgi:type VI secretion system secreted protein VgrG
VALAKWWYPKSKGSHDGELVLPGMASKWAAVALGNFVDTIKDIINRNAGAFSIKFEAVPWDKGMFLRPPVSASRPVAEGPQLATVVGPRGSTKGQSFVDHQLGRVRVRFPWQQKLAGGADFTDRFDTNHTTAWVPVSQLWAGTRVGSQFLPRIGDQVVVEYLDGDPERPIVTGCVYHADSGSSHLPFLNEDLHERQVTSKTLFEAAGQTVTMSGIHTHSTPKPERGQDRYHLLRFDDRYNDEQLLMRSQGRLDVTAKCSHFETTEGNRHVLVQAGTDADGKKIGGGSSFVTVGGEHDVHVGDSRYEAIDTDQQLTVKGDTHFDLKGDWINVVGGKLSLNAGTIVIEASQKLTLKVGGSTVVLNPCGVYIDGALIHNQGGGPADTAADVTIKDVADAVKADPGEPAYMRAEMPGGCTGGGGGGGRRRERTVPAQHGLPCTLDSEQMICLPLAQLCTE